MDPLPDPKPSQPTGEITMHEIPPDKITTHSVGMVTLPDYPDPKIRTHSHGVITMPDLPEEKTSSIPQGQITMPVLPDEKDHDGHVGHITMPHLPEEKDHDGPVCKIKLPGYGDTPDPEPEPQPAMTEFVPPEIESIHVINSKLAILEGMYEGLRSSLSSVAHFNSRLSHVESEISVLKTDKPSPPEIDPTIYHRLDRLQWQGIQQVWSY